MPPKNSIELGKGTLYIAQEGEAPIPLEGVQEVQELKLEPAEYILDKELGRMAEAAELVTHVDFTPLIEAVEKAWNNLKSFIEPEFTRLVACLSTYRNGRVRYLTLHAKKKKDRIKNMKRRLRGD